METKTYVSWDLMHNFWSMRLRAMECLLKMLKL